jgi:hypothetical protein
MANPSDAQLQDLVAKISDATKSYDGSESLAGMDSRAAIRGAARELFLSMSTPADNCWSHVLHVSPSTF